jgi:hypothetical protein
MMTDSPNFDSVLAVRGRLRSIPKNNPVESEGLIESALDEWLGAIAPQGKIRTTFSGCAMAGIALTVSLKVHRRFSCKRGPVESCGVFG